MIDRLHKDYSLREALDTNQRLLQELQHRVKNHITIITSLVRMRAKQVGSEEARHELAAIGERIEILRLVHEQLYIAGNADALRLRSFIMRVIENLCRLHKDESGKVRLDFAVEDVDLTPEVAVPLGLILNEFVTNSLKHAFDGRGGVIAVAVETMKRGELRLRISDDGVGLPSEPQAAKLGSETGIRLIEGLAHQIGAEPVWSSAQTGTTLCLEFHRRA